MGNTILIVEDDESLLPMLTYNLKKKGFNVKSASTGEEGLILIINSIHNMMIGTITNSFLPSDINFVIKFANKK